MGNAGNISAYWMGFKEYFEAGLSKQLPRMMGFQASGSAPLVLEKTIENPALISARALFPHFFLLNKILS